MIHIDYKDKRPIYEQVEEKFQDLIIRGVLKPDERLPSVRSLAIELSINPNTIQRAYAQLEQTGFLYTVKGRGNFVAAESEWMEQKQKIIFDEARRLVRRAANMGVSKEELLERIGSYYEEECI